MRKIILSVVTMVTISMAATVSVQASSLYNDNYLGKAKDRAGQLVDVEKQEKNIQELEKVKSEKGYVEGYKVVTDTDVKYFGDYKLVLEYINTVEAASVYYTGVLYVFDKSINVNVIDDKVDVIVTQNNRKIGEFTSYQEAEKYARMYENSGIYGTAKVYEKQDAYYIKKDNVIVGTSDNLVESIKLSEGNVEIYENIDVQPYSKLVYSNKISSSHKIQNVPLIMQRPELPRGCEVTSLAMVLNYNGIKADKMTLAKDVKKSPNRYDDPNNGFIGDMYSLSTHGLGVYHTPIYELGLTYTDKIVDLSSVDFEDLLYYIDNDMPVWIISNSRFNQLPSSEFVTWNIPTGSIQITYREHSVVVTGYDENYIYINDPLSGYGKHNRNDFIKAYNQMGKQAVVVLK